MAKKSYFIPHYNIPYKFRTKEFKDLQNEWYQKLKENGFADTESEKARNYNRVDSQRFTISRVSWARIQHFQDIENAMRILRTTENVEYPSAIFRDKTDIFIFDNYTQGVSEVELSRLLEKASEADQELKGMSQQAIGKRLKRILDFLGVEKITFNQ